MTVSKRNIRDNIPEELPEELLETIVAGDAARIERIVSRAQVTPDGCWYDQPVHEFVIVLQGGARLLFEGEQSEIAMEPGDWISIPAHTRHRVEWTDPQQDTIWLAVFYT